MQLMKKVAFIILSFGFFAMSAWGQNADQKATLDIFSIRGGYTWLTDEYLSALPYSGMTLNLKNEWWKLFNTENTAWQHNGNLNIVGAILYNQAGSNAITAFGANASWGAYYTYRPINDIAILGGAFADADYMGRFISRSVNKPYSMDLAANLNLSAGAIYTFSCRKSNFRLQYLVSTPFLGCMFVPEQGQSYYEMLFSLDNTIHASSFHNKLGLKQELTFDMRFQHSTWRIGVEHQYLKYHANELNFSREHLNIIVGYMLNYRSYGGNNKPDFLKTVW